MADKSLLSGLAVVIAEDAEDWGTSITVPGGFFLYNWY